MHKENWDDLRFVLAVADYGSVSAAARALGVNHATVLRRVAAFEQRHGGEIFDKTQNGYAVSADRREVIDAVREVDEAIHGVRRVIEGARSPIGGVVRVTSTDTLCTKLLPQILADLRAEAEDLRVDLICANAHLDLSRLAADIAVRAAGSLPDELTGASAGMLHFGVYASAQCDPNSWLGLSGEIARSGPAKWLAQKVPAENVVASADSFLTLARMASAGMGQAILPHLVGATDPGLQPVASNFPKMGAEIWVACHNDLAEVPRIRAVKDYLVRAISAEAAKER